MQFSVTFRHMEGTEALKNYAREKLEKIRKYFPEPISVSVVMSTERYNHRADIHVKLHNGLSIAGHESTENMYSSIDLVVAKIERQVRRYKGKLQTHKVKSDFPPLAWTHSVVSEEPPQPEVVENEPAPSPGPAIVERTKEFHAEPLSVDQAVMQINLLHKQFLVFRHAETGQVNVIYRRDDGSFGLIETTAPA